MSDAASKAKKSINRVLKFAGVVESITVNIKSNFFVKVTLL